MAGLLVLTGPTATGKTALGVELALRLGGEVVSVDSMQLYRGMDIGTSTPTQAEMRGVPHHMLSCVDPAETDYSVSRYVQQATACVEDILARGRLPILVGGTGLYIEALLRGTDFTRYDPELRRRCEQLYDEAPELAYARLQRCDPESARRIHPNDRKRVVRALEIYLGTGETMSEHDRRSRARAPRYPSCRIALNFRRRETLYARIDARVDRMLEQGLEQEVRALLEEKRLSPESTAMQAIGYKEMADYLSGKMTRERAVELIKQGSRRYAKRQLSWLRRDEGLNWLLWEEEPDYPAGCQISTAFMEKSGILETVRPE